MTFEVSFPIISGFSVFVVNAKSEEEAKELVMNGQYEDSYYDSIETDFDTNLMEIVEQ